MPWVGLVNKICQGKRRKRNVQPGLRGIAWPLNSVGGGHLISILLSRCFNDSHHLGQKIKGPLKKGKQSACKGWTVSEQFRLLSKWRRLRNLPCLLEIKVLTQYRDCGAENTVTQKLFGLNQELFHACWHWAHWLHNAVQSPSHDSKKASSIASDFATIDSERQRGRQRAWKGKVEIRLTCNCSLLLTYQIGLPWEAEGIIAILH